MKAKVLFPVFLIITVLTMPVASFPVMAEQTPQQIGEPVSSKSLPDWFDSQMQDENTPPADPRYVPVPPPSLEEKPDLEPPEILHSPVSPARPMASSSNCVAETDLQITQLWSGSAFYPGNEVEYKIDFINNGNAAARNVRITDTLPSNVTYVSDVAAKGFTTVITNGGKVVWTRQVPVNPGESGEVLLRLRIADGVSVGSILTNTVIITTSDPDSTPSDNYRQLASMIVSHTYDLSIDKSLYGGSFLPGNEIVYKLRINNTGNDTTHNVVLTDTLPNDFTYSSWSSDPNSEDHELWGKQIGFTVLTASHQLVWDLGDVTPANNGTIYLTGRVDSTAHVGEVLTNTASIATNDPETNLSDNTSSYVAAVGAQTWDVQITNDLIGSPTPDNVWKYRLYVYNNGNSTAHNVVLTNTLPLSVTYVSWSSSATDGSHVLFEQQITETVLSATRQIVWPIGDVGAFDADTIYLLVQADNSLPIDTVLTDTAIITTSNTDSNVGNNEAIRSDTVVTPTKDVRVTKSLYAGTTLPGNELSYKLDFYNDGNSIAHNVLLTDILPTDVTYLSWATTYGGDSHELLGRQVEVTKTSSQIIWPLGDMPEGSNGSIYVSVQVSPTAVSGNVLTNTATITTSDTDVAPGNDRDVRVDTIASPAAGFYLANPLYNGTPTPGNRVVYRIYLRNNGNITAKDVVLTHTLPPDATYLSWGNSSWSTSHYLFNHQVDESYNAATNQVVWPLGDINVGDYGYIYLTIQVTDTVTIGSVLTNTTEVTSSSPLNSSSANKRVRTDTIVTPTYDLQVTKSRSSDYPLPDREFQYTLHFSNNGNALINDAVLTDVLPSNISYVTWQGYMYNPNYTSLAKIVPVIEDGKISWPLENLVEGASGNIRLNVHVSETSPVREIICNHAYISSPNIESNLADNTYTNTLTVQYPVVDLQVAKSLYGSSGAPGGKIMYAIKIKNLGNTPASNVILTDTLPPNVIFYSWSGSFALLKADNGKLVWQLEDSLDPGSSNTLYLTVKLASTLNVGDILTNSVTVSSDAADLDLRDNEAILETAVISPTRNVYLSKQLWTQAVPGEILKYKLSFGNSGNFTATNVILTDTLPPSTTLTSWNGDFYNPAALASDPVIQDGKLVWHIGNLAAGQYGYYYIYLELDSNATPGTPLHNEASITCAETELDTSDNKGESDTTISAPERDVGVTLERAGKPAVPGQLFTYKIQLDNHGNAKARNVVITDTLPLSVTYVSWQGHVNDDYYYGGLEHLIAPTIISKTIVWAIGEVPAFGSGYIYLTVRVADTASLNSTLVNTVTIATSDLDTDMTNNTDVYQDVVTQTWDIQLSKQTYSTASPGNEIYYSIDIQNNGNMTVTNVVVTDTWPISMTYVSWYGASFVPYEVYFSPGDAVISTTQIRWPLKTLGPGHHIHINLTLRINDNAPNGLELVNKAAVTVAEQESDLSNNYAAYTMTVHEPTVGNLSVNKSIDVAGLPGGWMRYKIHFYNNGGTTVHNVVMTDTLPEQVSYLSWYASDSQISEITPTTSNGQVVWPIGDVQSHEGGYIYLTVRIKDSAQVGSVLLNKVEISTSDEESEYDDNSETVSYRLGDDIDSDLSISKYRSTPPAAAGHWMGYKIHVSNDGNYTATNVVLTDTLPLSTSLLAWHGDNASEPTVNGRDLVWHLGTLGAGEYCIIDVIVKVPSSIALHTPMVNEVLVTSDETESHYYNNKTCSSGRVLLPWTDLYADKYIDKYVNDAYPAPGEEISYDIYFGNSGNITATNSVLTDVLPTGVEYVTSSLLIFEPDYITPTGGQPTVINGQVVWHLGDILPGEEGMIHLTGRLSSTLTAGGRLTNVLYIRSDEEDFYPSNNTNILVTRVGELIPLAGVTIDGPSTVAIGKSTMFTASVSPVTATASSYIWSSENLLSGQGTAYGIYQWKQAGTYAITVTVQNAAGSVSDTKVITVVCVPLTSVAVNGPLTGTTNTPYTFNADVSPATASCPVTYTWTPVPSTGQGTSAASYTWSSPGAYSVTVAAQNCGGIVTASHRITITNVCPVPLTDAGISGPTQGYTGATYIFNALITPTNATLPITYTWTPAPSSGQSTAQARYSWDTLGTHAITLTAQNCGGTATVKHTIEITKQTPTSFTISPSVGGTLVYTDPQGITTTVQFPAGAVTATTEIVFTPVSSPTHPFSTELRFGNHAFTIEAYRGGQQLIHPTFSKSVTLTIHYSDTDIVGIKEESLTLYRWDDSTPPGRWQRVGERTGEGQHLYPEANTLVAWLRGLSLFGQAGTTTQNKIYLPLVLKNYQ